jgi:hypothetical protein
MSSGFDISGAERKEKEKRKRDTISSWHSRQKIMQTQTYTRQFVAVSSKF